MIRRFVVLLLAAIPVATLDGQPTGRRGGGMSPDPVRMQQGAQRLQAFVDSVVRVRLSPTDEQFTRIREVATRIEGERRELRMEEMRTRIDLRDELNATTVNEQRVTEMLERMIRVEKKRSELLEREQRELAKFLSPSQRARYLALQDELRRSMQEMQRTRMAEQPGGPGGPGRRGPPPEKRVPPPR